MKNSAAVSISFAIAILALISQSAWSATSEPSDLPVDLQNAWGKTVSRQEKSESRHFFDPLETANKTFQLIKHFGKGIYELADIKNGDHLSDAGYQFSESFLAPFELINAAISDTGALVKSSRYLTKRMSSRVQVCTGNLFLAMESQLPPALSMLMFADHIGVLIDGQEKFTDPGGGGLPELQAVGGADCGAVPIMSNEPESVAVERLTYIAENYNPDYGFLNKNCGYFTRDVLNASGFAYPILPNAGIGTEIPLTDHPVENHRDRKADVADLLKLKTESDAHLDRLRTMFAELEEGKIPDVALEPLELTDLGDDAFLQMIASASRGRNPASRDWVLQQYSSGAVDFPTALQGALLCAAHRMKSTQGKQSLQTMFEGLNPEDTRWAGLDLAVLFGPAPAPSPVSSQ